GAAGQQVSMSPRVRGGAGGRPTMREVAALAGVSLKTVSRVINAEPAVSDDVRSRVVGAIQRLDYRHDHAASSLRRSDRKTSTIGVLLEDVANPFSSALHREIEDVALRRGVLVLAGSSDEDEAREQQLIAAFTSRRVDGLIIVPASHDHSYLLSERRAGTSMVFVDRPPAFLDADRILPDTQAGPRQAAVHCIGWTSITGLRWSGSTMCCLPTCSSLGLRSSRRIHRPWVGKPRSSYFAGLTVINRLRSTSLSPRASSPEDLVRSAGDCRL